MDHHHDVERFGEWAPTYERHWMQRFLFDPVQRTVLDIAASQVSDPKAILDVGCGTGRLLRAAHARFPGALLDGVDAAPGMVEQAIVASGDRSRIKFQQATAEALPFEDASFNVVLSTLTFHHWADQAKGIAEVRRVLAPGGRWVLADFIAGVLADFIARGRMPERARLDAMLGAAGLQVVARRSLWRTLGNVAVVAIAARER
jgi:ubiquinone/menaquinone biosynthesis C-methylase UbiE